MFRQHVKHYHQWLRSSIHLQTKFSQSSPDSRPFKNNKLWPLVSSPLIRSGYKTLQKQQALASCIQSLLSKNTIERVENVTSLGFYNCLFLIPKPHQRWRPVIDLSKLNTFLLVERFKMETPESIRDSLIPGEWVSSIDLSDTYLHIPIYPNSRKYLRFCHKSQGFQFNSLPFGLATTPQVFTMIVKEVKLMALTRGIRLHQYWALSVSRSTGDFLIIWTASFLGQKPFQHT